MENREGDRMDIGKGRRDGREEEEEVFFQRF